MAALAGGALSPHASPPLVMKDNGSDGLGQRSVASTVGTDWGGGAGLALPPPTRLGPVLWGAAAWGAGGAMLASLLHSDFTATAGPQQKLAGRWRRWGGSGKWMGEHSGGAPPPLPGPKNSREGRREGS